MIMIYILIGVISIIWLLPPIKQKGTEYYQYFIIAATQSFVAIIYTFILKINVNYYYPAYYMLLLGTFYPTRMKRILWAAALVVIIVVPLAKLENNIIFLVSLISAFIIFILVLKIIIIEYIEKETVNIFRLLFMIYISINIFRFLSVAINTAQGIYSFYAGGAVQIVFGIVFTIMNVNTKTMYLPYKKEDKL